VFGTDIAGFRAARCGVERVLMAVLHSVLARRRVKRATDAPRFLFTTLDFFSRR
jgi:hypothetical protein